MGEGAKKKRAAEAKAAKKLKKTKETQLTDSEAPASASTDHDPTLSDAPAQSKARNSKKTGTVPRVPSVPSTVSTRQSNRLLGSSSTLGSVQKHKSVNFEGTDNKKTRPQRLATATAMALLQELQLSETEETEHDPEGVFTGNDEIDMIIELDDEDGETSGDEPEPEESDDGSTIEVTEEPQAVARKSLPKVMKVSAVQKKPPLQAIREMESESSSDEFGERFS
jgi:hypothetical protein